MRTLREWMRDPRVAGLLGGMAILLVGYRLYSTVVGKPARSGMPAVAAPEETAPEPERGTPEATGPDAAVRTSPRTRNSIRWSWDRNPFLPSETLRGPAGPGGTEATGESAKESTGVADLRGTVITGHSGIAIFGDRLVPAGGTIDGWTVVKVDPYAVSLRRGGEPRQVEMFKPAP